VIALLTLMAATAGPVARAETATVPGTPEATPVAPLPGAPGSGQPPQVLVNASTLVGSKVKDLAGKEVGEIRELMVDARSGQVAYVVLATGGMLGLGRTRFAVPFKSLTVSQDGNAIVLNARGEVLPRAPASSAEWPDLADPSVQGRVQAYWQDASITAAVKWKLATERVESLRDIDVTTSHGSVALSGRVANEEMRTRAEALARQVAGVRRVENNLEVRN
jgi:sporulation protein YlmC with PRC-barrel domain